MPMSGIKRLPDDDIDRFLEIVYDAYPVFQVVTDEDRKKGRERFDRANADPRNSLFGLYRNGELLGGIRLHDYRMNLFGRKVLAGGAGMLAVGLLHKKQHVAKELMQFYFRHFREKGAPLALLWSFRPDFYRNMGCGYGSKGYQYHLKPRQFPSGAPPEHIRYLTSDDIPRLTRYYNRVVDGTHGMIEESELGWEMILEKRREVKYIGFDSDGELSGYMAFSFQKGRPTNFLDNSLIVNDLVYDSPAVLAEFMAFLRTQADQVKEIIIRTQDDDFHHLLEDSRSTDEDLIGPIYHASHTAGIGIMYRLLDVNRIFDTLKNRNFAGQNLKISLTVNDTFLPENECCFIVCFEDGRPRVTENDAYDVAVDINVSDFTSLIMGTVGFESLYRYSRVSLSDLQYLDQLHELFRTDRWPVCLTIF